MGGGDVDNAAPAALLHHGQSSLDRVKRRQKIDAEDRSTPSCDTLFEPSKVLAEGAGSVLHYRSSIDLPK